MRAKTITLILAFFCLLIFVHSQETELDSLKTLYREASSDSIRMNLCLKICRGYFPVNLDSSRKFQEIGFRLAKKRKKSEDLAESYQNLAYIEYGSGNYDSSLAIAFKAVDMYEELGNEMKIAYVYTETLGPLYSRMRQYNKSTALYQKAISIFESPGENMTFDQKLSKAAVLSNMAGPYYRSQNIDSAILCMKAAFSLQEKLSKDTVDNLEIISRMAVTANNLGFLYSENEEYNDGLVYLLKSYELSKENNLDFILISNLNCLSDVYIKLGNYDLALETSLQAYESSKNMNNLGRLKVTSIAVTNAYKAKKDYKNAFKFVQKYMLYSDSLLNETNLKQMSELSTKYETEKKEQENKMLKANNELNNKTIQMQRLLVFLFGGALLFVSILIWMMYRNRKKLKALNIQIQDSQKKTEIANVELKTKSEELEKFNKIMLDREMRIIELKKEANNLAQKSNLANPYPEVGET